LARWGQGAQYRVKVRAKKLTSLTSTKADLRKVLAEIAPGLPDASFEQRPHAGSLLRLPIFKKSKANVFAVKWNYPPSGAAFYLLSRCSIGDS